MAETAVSSLYFKYGYKILERNWFCNRIGEIDVIAEKNGVLVFIEVKCRNEKCFYSPSESVNINKRNRIRKAADKYILLYSKLRGTEDPYVRFDVAEVIESGDNYRINIIKNAF